MTTLELLETRSELLKDLELCDEVKNKDEFFVSCQIWKTEGNWCSNYKNFSPRSNYLMSKMLRASIKDEISEIDNLIKSGEPT